MKSKLEKLKEEIVQCDAINVETMRSEGQANVTRRS
jgi:hypothetical protein